ncbi:fimbrial protein [Citrobacter amalonaticus]|uniref:fimbrial protein n=1 Tax=Citrobacter amalonaticus TaxID=35703 RepID=UPI0019059BFB|nr:fimbrial protein [Citrobacter amalonaticus]EKW5093967.1 fimbrial protein [Citrobacter amalonaticus]MBJ9318394.1 fimbrial protein [Citrobacter amalonaticus]
MKITISSCVFFLAFWMQNALGYDVLLNVTGHITASGCILDSESEIIDIDMKDINITQLAQSSNRVPVIPFTIRLKDCAASVSGAVVTFSGVPDNTNSDFLALAGGGASGVAIKLMDKDKTIVPINSTSKNYLLTEGNTMALQFYAQYIATGSLLSAGDANSTATYTVTFP